MRNDEPPSGAASGLFLVGRNSRGNWVVQDSSGRRGGLFVDRVQAVKFAMSKSGNRPHAVITVPGVLELDLNARPAGQRRLGA